ncbi:MAG: hypothetical protein O7B25_16285, partial [Gammaproteobacteria bacterium]|nr:hypothetical protein [Gammaproteobacteria bacterium]
SISVGQRVVAFGEFVPDASASTFDAREGRVRMVINQLTAQVVVREPLAVDLYFLNGHHPAAFDFHGTGFTPAEDSDPDFYEIATGALSLSAISDGDLIRVRGFVNEYGTAPPDYLAHTVIDVRTDLLSASLKVGWEAGTQMPFEAISSERVDLNLHAARAAIQIIGVPVALSNPLDHLALIAPASGAGAYAVGVRGSDEIQLYRTFADLVDELTAQLDAGNLLHRISAHGSYNDATEELTSGRASFVFGSPMPAEG